METFERGRRKGFVRDGDELNLMERREKEIETSATNAIVCTGRCEQWQTGRSGSSEGRNMKCSGGRGERRTFSVRRGEQKLK